MRQECLEDWSGCGNVAGLTRSKDHPERAEVRNPNHASASPSGSVIEDGFRRGPCERVSKNLRLSGAQIPELNPLWDCDVRDYRRLREGPQRHRRFIAVLPRGDLA